MLCGFAAPERSVAVLEGQHPLEGARPARSHREHDPALRQGQGDASHLFETYSAMHTTSTGIIAHNFAGTL